MTRPNQWDRFSSQIAEIEQEWPTLPQAERNARLSIAHGALRFALAQVDNRNALALVEALRDDLKAVQNQSNDPHAFARFLEKHSLDDTELNDPEPDSAPAVPVTEDEEPTLVNERTETMTAAQYAALADSDGAGK